MGKGGITLIPVQMAYVHADPKQAMFAAALARALSAEYPALQLTWITDPEACWLVSARDPEATFHLPFGALDEDTLSHVLEACEAFGFDPEAGYDDEDDKRGGSVVAEGYKAEYKARGDASNCGDWLAKLLDGRFDVNIGGKKKAFDVDAYTAFLVANNVPMTGKWADLPTSGQPGWVGRYRMNGRQKLAILIATRGTVIVEGGDGAKGGERADGGAAWRRQRTQESGHPCAVRRSPCPAARNEPRTDLLLRIP